MSRESRAAPGLERSLKHELRTPLNHIIGYCEMLIEETNDSDEAAAVLPDLERIHTAGRHLLGVMNDLFDPDKAPAYRTDQSLLDHEVRTPLNQIIGYSELLQEEAADRGAAFLADLGKIHAAARRLLDQVIEHFGEKKHDGLPLACASSLNASPRPPSAAISAAQIGRILVVDDDAANRDMLSRRLIRLGHMVETAENGRQALEMLRRTSFDLLLLDLQMPEINGYQVLERMRTDPALREVPVIVLSASDEIVRIAHCIEMGAADYLAKPFDPVLLRARIDASLERKKLRDRERAAHEALASELAKAANYVRSLLPEPMTDGRVQSEWCFQPSEQLGGDAFGHHWIDDDHLAIYLLDVCGHGVGAALLSVSVLHALRATAFAHSDFRAYNDRGRYSWRAEPDVVLSALNRAFPAEQHNFFYFTIWYAVYQPSRRELRYSSGGHPPALLLDRDQVIPLVTEGASIGCFENAQFVTARHSVNPGARLLLFSDGVFEIFLSTDRVQTWDEFRSSFDRSDVAAMRPVDRLKEAHALRGADMLEDDFSLLEIRFA